MKKAKITSDYSSSILSLIQTDDGDIIVNIYDRGEFRLATSGGKLRGQYLVDVLSKFSELIDLLNKNPEDYDV